MTKVTYFSRHPSSLGGSSCQSERQHQLRCFISENAATLEKRGSNQPPISWGVALRRPSLNSTCAVPRPDSFPGPCRGWWTPCFGDSSKQALAAVKTLWIFTSRRPNCMARSERAERDLKGALESWVLAAPAFLAPRASKKATSVLCSPPTSSHSSGSRSCERPHPKHSFSDVSHTRSTNASERQRRISIRMRRM